MDGHQNCSGPFRVSNVNNTRFEANGEDYTLKYRGYDFNVLQYLKQALNFSYRLVTPEDQKWGKISSNGSWTGILGQIQRKEADFSCSCVSVTEQRVPYFSYTLPYDFEPIIFATHVKTGVERVNRIFYLTPFGLRIWVCLFVTMLSLRVLQHFLLGASAVWSQEDVTFRAVFRQNARVDQRGTDGTRLFIGSCLLGLGTIGTIFCCVLTAANSHERKSVNVDTFEDVQYGLQYKDFKLVLEEDVATFEVLKTRRLVTDLEISQKVITAPTTGDALSMVTNEGYVYVGEQSLLFMDSLNLDMSGELYLAREHLYEDKLAVVFRKNFSCSKKFNELILTMMQTGLTLKWRGETEWIFTYRTLQKASDSRNQLINFDDTVNILLLCLLCLSSGSICLITEYMVCKSQSRKRAKVYSKRRQKRTRIEKAELKRTELNLKRKKQKLINSKSLRKL